MKKAIKIKTIYGEEFIAIQIGQNKENILTDKGYIPINEIEEYSFIGEITT